MSRTTPVWMAYHMRSWLIQGQEPEYLSQHTIEVVRIMYERDKKARILLRGYLPQAKILEHFPDGAALEVHWGVCTDPRRYDANACQMRFDNCTYRRRWIAVVREEALIMYVEIEASEVP